MSKLNLPSGWAEATLGSVLLAVIGGGTPSRKVPAYFGGQIPWFTVKDMKALRPNDAEEHITEAAISASATNLVPANTLIVATRIALGRAIRPTVACAINQDLKALVLGSGIDSDFLLHWVGANQRVIQDLGSGTTVSGIRLEALHGLPLLLPPAAEQTRIVAKLEELLSDLDAGAAELKAAQKKLAQYRQSLLKAAVEGALTAEWRAQNTSSETGAQLLERILQERLARWEAKQLVKFKEQGKTPPKDWQKKYPEPVRPDITDLPTLPEGWVWASVDQLTVEQKYGSSSKTNEDPIGVPVLRMGNIQDGNLDLSNLKYLPVDHAEFPGLHLQDGDLLFNRTNSPELVGKTAVYRSQISPCSFASYLISVRFSAGYIPEIASAFINSAYGKRWIKSVVVQQVGQANVNGSKLSGLAVPVPPFKEQQEIVSVLHAQASEIVDQLKSVDISLKQSNAQRQNILRAAYAGLLVPQDPNDEPASVLLERIRVERAERAKQPKTRKTKPKEIATMVSRLIDVLAEAGDWMPAQEAFRRCGVADGALTERIEELYAELRKLDKAGRLAVEAVTDAQGRKLYDKLKLLVG
ncbi:restriction endonuclease subunit S [Pseudomonas sp.]|uniref:restriction endonuclease subunit S n=1 Tax=Pseudomonas sp. TaxID=306 RepID=UPI0028965709|nr:restriction endonuclease subunit S [Pseudomonas sp.]